MKYFHQLPYFDRVYLCKKFGCSFSDISNPFIEKKLDHIAVQVILNKKPISKILYEKHFWKHVFYTGKFTLDPRPETERIIEIIKENHTNFNSVLELGVGTGALICSLLLEYEAAKGLGVDICPRALGIAYINKCALGVYNLQLRQNNWLDDINTPFDILISNPPYLDDWEIKNELIYDPYISLVEPEDLFFYKKIAEKQYLFSHIYLEINYRKLSQCLKIFPSAKIYRDYLGCERFLYITK